MRKIVSSPNGSRKKLVRFGSASKMSTDTAQKTLPDDTVQEISDQMTTFKSDLQASMDQYGGKGMSGYEEAHKAASETLESYRGRLGDTAQVAGVKKLIEESSLENLKTTYRNIRAIRAPLKEALKGLEEVPEPSEDLGFVTLGKKYIVGPGVWGLVAQWENVWPTFVSPIQAMEKINSELSGLEKATAPAPVSPARQRWRAERQQAGGTTVREYPHASPPSQPPSTEGSPRRGHRRTATLASPGDFTTQQSISPPPSPLNTASEPSRRSPFDATRPVPPTFEAPRFPEPRSRVLGFPPGINSSPSETASMIPRPPVDLPPIQRAPRVPSAPFAPIEGASSRTTQPHTGTIQSRICTIS